MLEATGAGARSEALVTRYLLAVVAALSVGACGFAARADEGLTLRSGIVPMNEQGRLTGCQAPFEAVRSDPEYSGGRRMRVEGKLSVITPGGKAAGVLLQLVVHAPDDAADADGVTPIVLMLKDGERDNSAERYPQQTDEDGGPLYVYGMGPVTEATLRQIASEGRFTLAYALKDGGPLAAVTIDLTMKRRVTGERDPGAPQAFADCLRRLRLGDLIR
ncbi:MAG: hypothetical protein JWP35_2215 [Caulobacter sp.]|nr:hypothetical protein [Caulobacter sp.]